MPDLRLDVAPTLADDGAASRGEPAAEIGARVGRYQILEIVGRGSMGVVAAAYDPNLDRRVALKLLRPDPSTRAVSGNARRRLLREARAMASLSHPNVLTVHEVGEEGDAIFVAMEFADGGTLRSWLREAQRDWRAVVDRFLSAGRGLAAAHRAGLVHRDFKPDNVMLTRDGAVRVGDFGLVRAQPARTPTLPQPVDSSTLQTSPEAEDSMSAEGEAPLTVPGATLGTPGYMAPEQYARGTVGPEADQFAFCVGLYEALYGRRPFEGDSYLKLAQNVVTGRLSEPDESTHVPQRVWRVIRRGLEVARESRWPSMDALLVALADAVTPWTRRARVGIAVAVALLVAALGAFAWSRADGAALRAAVTPCAGMDERFAGAWDDDRRAAVRAAFEATGRSYAAQTFEHVAASLDQYANGWTAAATAACQATHVRGEQSSALLDVRMACLERARGDVTALVKLYAAADGALLDRAASAVASLPSLAPCADTEALIQAPSPPHDPVVRAELEDAQRQLAEARALIGAGRYAEAAASLAVVVSRAEAIGHRPLIAEAMVARADALRWAGDGEAAEALLGDALVLAARGKLDRLVAEIWLERLAVAAEREPERGWQMRDAALVAVERAGADDALAAERALVVASAAIELANYDDAKALLGEALAVRTALYGADSLEVAEVENRLGTVYGSQAALEPAWQHYERALAIYERRLGAGHPSVATMLSNLGIVRFLEGRYADADALHERAHGLRVAALGPDHPQVADSHVNGGNIHYMRAEFEAAQASYAEALRIYEAALGPDHPRLGFALSNLGSALLKLGRYDAARANLVRALALRERSLGVRHPHVVEVLINLGSAETAMGRLDEARARFDRAAEAMDEQTAPLQAVSLWNELGVLELADGHPAAAVEVYERALQAAVAPSVAPVQRADAELGLAKALRAARRSPGRVRELAALARSRYLEAGDPMGAVHSIDAWLGTR